MGARTANMAKMTSKITPGTHKFNKKTEEFRPKLGQIMDNSTKNGRRSALYFLLLGMCCGRQSIGLIEITTENIDIVPKTSLANTMGGTNLVYKPLGGTVAGTAVGTVYIYI